MNHLTKRTKAESAALKARILPLLPYNTDGQIGRALGVSGAYIYYLRKRSTLPPAKMGRPRKVKP